MSPQNNETYRPNESIIEIKCENEEPSSSVQNDHNNTPRPFLSFRRRALIRGMRRNARRRQRVQNSNTSNSTANDDNDVQFFMSLLPYLQALPANIRLRIRDKVQRVVIEEVVEYNNEGSSNDHNNRNNRNLPTPRPLNYHSVVPQGEVPQEEEAQNEQAQNEQAQDQIQHPVPVYPFRPYYSNVYGNVNNFISSALPQSSEYSFNEQQAIPSYAGQQIYQPVPHLAGQHPLPSLAGQHPLSAFVGQHPLPSLGGQQPSSAFAGQQPLQAFAGQQPLSTFAGQQSLQAFAGQQYSPPFVRQQQHNMPYFARQQ